MNSELRQDLVSGDWIVMAPARGKKPAERIPKKEKRIRTSVGRCPFENPQKSGNAEPIAVYPNRKSWRIQIIPNRYPALSHYDGCAKNFKQGPYSAMDGRGYHHIAITRDHDKNFAHLGSADALSLFKIFQSGYLASLKDKCLAYILIFHNWGPKAGASVYHPHYQVVGIPVIPPDVGHSLRGSARYFNKNKKCVHCVMIEWEKKNKKRVVFENKNAIAFTPFVSREPFEVRIFPKKHLSYFEDTPIQHLKSVVDLLQKSLLKIEKKLGDPDYNFFIHTAPVQNKKRYHHYHWHIEILPKISISAGFELGTGIEITVVNPDEAAGRLRN